VTADATGATQVNASWLGLSLGTCDPGITGFLRPCQHSSNTMLPYGILDVIISWRQEPLEPGKQSSRPRAYPI